MHSACDLLNNAVPSWATAKPLPHLLRGALTSILFFTTLPSAFGQYAPPLVSMQISQIRSEASPVFESVRSDTGSTSRNHGGRWLEVQLTELGLANPSQRGCAFNGTAMQFVSRVNAPLPSVGGQFLGRVTAAIARLFTYTVTYRLSTGAPITSGAVVCRAVSAHPPLKSFTDQIGIR